MSALELGGRLGSLLGQVWEKARTTTAGGGRPAAVRVLGRATLTPAHSVHLVEVEGKRLVVGCHSGGFLLLDRVAQEEEGS